MRFVKTLVSGFLLWLGLLASVQPQSLSVVGAPPFPGTPIGNALAFAGPLYVGANAVLQNNLPFGSSEWVKIPAGTAATTSSVNTLAAVPDGTPPTCSITNPTNGFSNLSGSVNLTATCSHAIGISSVKWFVDGAELGASSASPYTTAWNTAKAADGSHTITLYATNLGDYNSAAITSTGTTSNGVSNKTVYLNPSSTSDCPTNNGLSSSSPCKTLAGVQTIINSNPLVGGDSILMLEGSTLNITDMTRASTLTLAGQNCTSSACGVAQNVYPGKTITLGTYGGGSCNPLAGTTSGCANITLSANGTVPIHAGVISFYNVPNVLMQHFRITGSQSNAISCASLSSGCAYGVRYSAVNNYYLGMTSSSGTTNFQYNEIIDFYVQFYIANTESQFYASRGSGPCGVTIQDNYLHGSSHSVQVWSSLLNQGAGCQYDNGNALTISSNFQQYAGGLPGSANAGSGVGFGHANGAYNIVDQYNVGANNDYNANTCGGGYSFETYQTQNVQWLGNEAFNVFPTASGGVGNICDMGAFDLDLSTSNATALYNYAHETWGPSIGLLPWECTNCGGSLPAGNLTVAYNIMENGTMFKIDASGGMTSVGAAQDGFFNVYNNDIWNGYNGTTNTLNGNQVGVAALTYGYCSTTYTNIAANNVTVATHNSNYGAIMVTNATGVACTGSTTWRNNAWYWLAPSPVWWGASSMTRLSSLSAWNASSGDTGINVNPNYAGSGGGAGTTCYSSGVSVQPGTIPCPTNYELQTGNTMIGAGLNLSSPPYNLTRPSKDFFNGTIPNGVGTGYNLGADGAHH